MKFFLSIDGIYLETQKNNFKDTVTRFNPCSKNRLPSRLGGRLGATRHSYAPIYAKSVKKIGYPIFSA